MNNKRFLVFAYDHYYPCGGWTDFKSAHDSLEEAKVAADNLNAERRQYDLVEIVDLEKLTTV